MRIFILINAIFLLVSDFPDAEFHELTHGCKRAILKMEKIRRGEYK